MKHTQTSSRVTKSDWLYDAIMEGLEHDLVTNKLEATYVRYHAASEKERGELDRRYGMAFQSFDRVLAQITDELMEGVRSRKVEVRKRLKKSEGASKRREQQEVESQIDTFLSGS